MDHAEYLKMAAVEARMWWYRGLHGHLLALLGARPRWRRLLDAGCGTGGFLRRLAGAFPDRDQVGLEIEPLAAALAAEASGSPICVGSVNALPFAPGTVEVIVSADVLYHRAVDEAAALAGFHACLAPGGLLVLNLPAYEWMRGPHDRAVHTARRYTRRGLCRLLTQAGFRPLRCTYWNSFLFPLMVVRRKLMATAEAKSDVMTYPAPIEALFGLIMRLETALIARGIDLPFGGSVLALAVKP